MEELIRITTKEDGSKVVSARDLYLALGFDKSNWSGWAHKNIVANEFAFESIDWERFVLNTSVNNSYDYAITIDFAKRVCMLARTGKGEEIRRYFLDCEKLALSPIKRELSRKELALLIVQAEEEKEQLALQLDASLEIINEMVPKVEYAEKVLLSESDITTTSIAAELGMSAIALNKKLAGLGVQRRHDKKWILYSNYQGNGYTTTRTYPFTASDGTQKTEIHTVWTEKGREFIHSLISKSNVTFEKQSRVK